MDLLAQPTSYGDYEEFVDPVASGVAGHVYHQNPIKVKRYAPRRSPSVHTIVRTQDHRHMRLPASRVIPIEASRRVASP